MRNTGTNHLPSFLVQLPRWVVAASAAAQVPAGSILGAWPRAASLFSRCSDSHGVVIVRTSGRGRSKGCTAGSLHSESIDESFSLQFKNILIVLKKSLTVLIVSAGDLLTVRRRPPPYSPSQGNNPGDLSTLSSCVFTFTSYGSIKTVEKCSVFFEMYNYSVKHNSATCAFPVSR